MVGTSHLGSWKGHWVMVKSSLGNLRILPPCCYLWVGVAPWLKVARNGKILFWLGTLEAARTASGQYCSIMQQTIQKAPCLHGFRSRNTGVDFALPSRRDCFSPQWSHQVPSFWSYWTFKYFEHKMTATQCEWTRLKQTLNAFSLVHCPLLCGWKH